MTATASTLSLNRDTGTMSGLITAEKESLIFAPQSMNTGKGDGRIEADGIFTYTPRPAARHAATRPDAAFFGHHRDTLSVLACDAAGAGVRVHTTIAILGF